MHFLIWIIPIQLLPITIPRRPIVLDSFIVCQILSSIDHQGNSPTRSTLNLIISMNHQQRPLIHKQIVCGMMYIRYLVKIVTLALDRQWSRLFKLDDFLSLHN